MKAPIDKWRARAPERCVDLQVEQGRTVATLLQGSVVMGRGTGDSAEEATANALNDAFAREWGVAS